MPGTKETPDQKPTLTDEERRELRKAAIEECIDHLDECGYFGAARILRRDLKEREIK